MNTYKKDGSGDLTNPDTVELRIYSPSGALYAIAGSSEIIHISTGIYGYNFIIPDDADTGWWINKWTSTTNNLREVTRDQFYVKDPERRLYTMPPYVYSRAGQDENFMSKDDVTYFIMEAMKEVDDLMGKKYDYSTRETQWFDIVEPDKHTIINKIFLRYTPLRYLISLEEYDTNGGLAITHTTDDYYTDLKTGRVALYRKEFIHQPHRVKVVYNYGFDQVPRDIQQLTTVIAALKMLLNHIGNSVDDITSYSACGISLSVGEPYTASARAIELLVKEMQRIIAAIGRTKESIHIG